MPIERANSKLPSLEPESTYTALAFRPEADCKQRRRRSPSLRPMTTSPTVPTIRRRHALSSHMQSVRKIRFHPLRISCADRSASHTPKDSRVEFRIWILGDPRQAISAGRAGLNRRFPSQDQGECFDMLENVRGLSHEFDPFPRTMKGNQQPCQGAR